MPKVSLIAKTVLPSRFGSGTTKFDLYAFRNTEDGYEHLVLSNRPSQDVAVRAPLVRIHSECLTGDVFGSKRCDCGLQLQRAVELIEKDGNGLLIYLRGHEGRGIGLANKIRAYALQDHGADTVEANEQLGFEADMRSYAVAASILRVLGVESVRILTNNPRKVSALDTAGIMVVQRVPLQVTVDSCAEGYLAVKREKLGHFLKTVGAD